MAKYTLFCRDIKRKGLAYGRMLTLIFEAFHVCLEGQETLVINFYVIDDDAFK